MCQRCYDLEEEVAFLKRELGILRSHDIENRLCVTMGVTKSEAAVLALLLNRRGTVMSKGSVWDVLYAGGETEPELKIIDVYFCKLRRRLPEDSIATVWGRGYIMTAIGLAHCDAALARAPGDLSPPAPLRTRTPMVRGLGATIPILRKLRDGPATSFDLQGVVVPERQYQVSSIVGKLVRDGRAERVRDRGRGKVNIWGITPAGKAWLTDWERTYAPALAA